MTEFPKSKKKSKLWKLIALVAIVGGGGGYYYLKSSRKIDIPQYSEVYATKGFLEITVLSTGTVEPQNRLEIKPPIAGRIETLLVEEGESVKTGTRLAWMSSTERAALLDAARASGSEEAKKWEEIYKPSAILAPISGTIISIKVKPGQTFSTNDPVMVMSDRLAIKAQVDENDIAQIANQQTVNIVLDAYPNSPIKGHVERIAFDAITVNNVTMYAVDVIPDEVPAFMRSGMTANVTFFITRKEDILTLQSDAIKVKEGRYYVLLKNKDSKSSPEERLIEIGLTDGKVTEIKAGIDENDVILTNNITNTLSNSPKKNGANPMNPFGSSSRGGKR